VSDFTANVLVETISFRLDQPGIRNRVTGKFLMDRREGRAENPALLITVELEHSEVHTEGRARHGHHDPHPIPPVQQRVRELYARMVGVTPGAAAVV
jgi:hypothetical protein